MKIEARLKRRRDNYRNVEVMLKRKRNEKEGDEEREQKETFGRSKKTP